MREMTGISENVPATSEDLRRFPEDLQTLPKMSEDVLTISEHFRSYLGELNWIFVVNVLKSKLSRFVSQAWEIVLDAWDRCLWSTGVRLTHNAWELAGLQFACQSRSRSTEYLGSSGPEQLEMQVEVNSSS